MATPLHFCDAPGCGGERLDYPVVTATCCMGTTNSVHLNPQCAAKALRQMTLRHLPSKVSDKKRAKMQQRRQVRCLRHSRPICCIQKQDAEAFEAQLQAVKDRRSKAQAGGGCVCVPCEPTGGVANVEVSNRAQANHAAKRMTSLLGGKWGKSDSRPSGDELMSRFLEYLDTPGQPMEQFAPAERDVLSLVVE